MRRGRLIVGSLGVLLVVAAFAWACTGLHAFGHGVTRYGEMVARATVPQRAATNAVAAVTFDFRGFDTLGEEFILFIAVIGASILLRTLRSEASEEEKHVEEPGPGGASLPDGSGRGSSARSRCSPRTSSRTAR